MSGAKRQLEEEMERAAEEYRKESLCPNCGDEREEITLDHNTFWVCDTCDTDQDDLDDIDDMPPDDEPDQE
jgi:ribosomal protein L37AE/L43A